MAEPHDSHARGTQTCAILGFAVAALIWIAAGYLFVAPLGIQGKDGFPIPCGSAASPPDDSLTKTLCGTWPRDRLLQSGAVAAGGLVVAVASAVVIAGQRRSVSAAEVDS